MKIVNRKIKDLIGAEYNPRELTKDQYKQLKDSLLRFGVVDPVIVNKHPERDNIIIGGHQRSKVWGDMGNESIPTVELSLTLDKEKELNVRLNKNTGQFDMDMLANHFETDDLIEWGFSEGELVGFDDIDLDAEEDDFDVPDGGIETDIVAGDLFEIGEHRLLCGDSTDSDSVAKLMNGNKADTLLIDPPYNIDFKAQRTGKGYDTHNDNLSNNDYLNLNKEIYNNSLLFSDKAIVTCGKQNLKMWIENFDITDIAIWIAKNKMSGGRISNLSLWEPILFIGKFDRNDRPTDLFEYSTKFQKDADSHPCPKVIEFFAELIKSYTKKSVLDLYLGSGTTMVASHQLKRKCYGMELDPKYCQVIVDRMMKLDDKLVVKLNGKPYEKELVSL